MELFHRALRFAQRHGDTVTSGRWVPNELVTSQLQRMPQVNLMNGEHNYTMAGSKNWKSWL